MQNGKKVKLTKRKPTRGASKMKLEKTDYEPDADDKREKEKLYLFEDELAESSQLAVNNICDFMTGNKNLVHIDFTNTGLTEQQMWFFGRAMLHAPSLRSIHLS